MQISICCTRISRSNISPAVFNQIYTKTKSKHSFIHEELTTKTIEIGSQIYHRVVLSCPMQGMKPQCFRYLKIQCYYTERVRTFAAVVYNTIRVKLRETGFFLCLFLMGTMTRIIYKQCIRFCAIVYHFIVKLIIIRIFAQ